MLRSIFATEFETTDASSFHYEYGSRGGVRALGLLMFTYWFANDDRSAIPIDSMIRRMSIKISKSVLKFRDSNVT